MRNTLLYAFRFSHVVNIFTYFAISARGGWLTRAHQAKTQGAAAVLRGFLKYLSVICAKRNFKSSSTIYVNEVRNTVKFDGKNAIFTKGRNQGKLCAFPSHPSS